MPAALATSPAAASVCSARAFMCSTNSRPVSSIWSVDVEGLGDGQERDLRADSAGETDAMLHGPVGKLRPVRRDEDVVVHLGPPVCTEHHEKDRAMLPSAGTRLRGGRAGNT